MQFAVGTQRAGGVGDAVTHLEALDLTANRLDHPGTFGAQARGQRWRLVQAAAEIGVDEVQADGAVGHTHFARAWRCRLVVTIFQHVAAAVLAELDTLGHRGFLV